MQPQERTAAPAKSRRTEIDCEKRWLSRMALRQGEIHLAPFQGCRPSSHKPRAALRLPGATLFRASGAPFLSQDAKLRFSA
jgi:hypothetical protein